MENIIKNLILFYNKNISWKELIVRPHKRTLIYSGLFSIITCFAFIILYIKNDNQLYIFLTTFVMALYLLLLTYLLYLSLKKYGLTKYMDFFNTKKKEPFQRYQRNEIKEYLKGKGIYDDKILKVIYESINRDNKVPKIETNYVSILISIFFIPVFVKILDWYLLKFDKTSINYTVELIKISIISIGLAIFLYQIIGIFQLTKKTKYSDLKYLSNLIEDIRIEKMIKTNYNRQHIAIKRKA